MNGFEERLIRKSKAYGKEKKKEEVEAKKIERKKIAEENRTEMYRKISTILNRDYLFDGLREHDDSGVNFFKGIKTPRGVRKLAEKIWEKSLKESEIQVVQSGYEQWLQKAQDSRFKVGTKEVVVNEDGSTKTTLYTEFGPISKTSFPLRKISFSSEDVFKQTQEGKPLEDQVRSADEGGYCLSDIYEGVIPLKRGLTTDASLNYINIAKGYFALGSYMGVGYIKNVESGIINSVYESYSKFGMPEVKLLDNCEKYFNEMEQIVEPVQVEHVDTRAIIDDLHNQLYPI